MYQPLVRGLLAFPFILTFVVSFTPHAAYAALTQDQAAAVAGLLRSFGADESMIASVEGQVLGIAVPDDYTNVAGDQYPSYCPTLSTTLQLGSRGTQVTEFQHFLSGRYNIAPQEIMTGYFGTITRGYAQEFQREQGLPSFGTVGPLTRAAIRVECGGSTPTPTSVPTATGGNLTISVASSPSSGTVVPGIPDHLATNITLDATGSAHDIRVGGLSLIYMDNITTDPTNCRIFDGATALTTGTHVINPNNNSSAPNGFTYNFFFDNLIVISHGTVKTLGVRCNLSSSATSGSFSWGLSSGASVGPVDVTTGLTILPTVIGNLGPTWFIAPGGGGTVGVSSDASTPGYQIAAAGSTGVTLGVYRLYPTLEPFNLNKLNFYLSSGSSADIVRLSIYSGAALIGSGYFPGPGQNVTVTLPSSVQLQPNTDARITVKADLAQIGTGWPAVSGDLIKLELASVEGTGASSGKVIAGNNDEGNKASPSRIAGVRIFKSYPTVSLDTLPSTGLADGRLMRFKIAADPHGPVGLGRLGIAVLPSTGTEAGNITLYAYEDSNYSSPIGGVNSDGSVPATDPGSWWPSPAFPIQVPAGVTRYFEVRGTVSGVTSGSSITTTLLGDSVYSGVGTYQTQKEKGYFIWSPNSTTSATKATADWTNGYGVPGLPSSGLTQTRWGSGVTPPGGTPTVDIKAAGADNWSSYATIGVGTSVNISWTSANVSSCNVTSGSLSSWGGNLGTANSGVPSHPLYTSTTFTIQCTGSNGQTVSDTVTVMVEPTTITMSTPTNGASYQQGTVFPFSWSVTNAPPKSQVEIEVQRVPSDNPNGPALEIWRWQGPELNGNSTGSHNSNVWDAGVPGYPSSVGPFSPGTYRLYAFVLQCNPQGCNYPRLASGVSSQQYASLTTVPFNFTVTAPVTNSAPSVPTVTVPTKVYPNAVYSMTFTSTDPNGDQVRFGIDDGINDVHWWTPSPGYTTSGVAFSSPGWVWPSIGSRTYKVLAEDVNGARSAWGSFTVNVTNPPTGGGGGGGVQP